MNNSNLNSYNRMLREWLDRAFTALLQTASSRINIRPSDKVGLKFMRSNTDSFSISFRRFDQYSPELITSSISRILQSNAEFLFDENLLIELSQIRNDVGFGKNYRVEGWLTKNYSDLHKRSVHLIRTDVGRENLCLAYALVLGIAHADQNKNDFNFLKYQPNIDEFTKRAVQLCENANVDLAYGGGIEELKRFQNYFGDKYNIIVFKDRKGRSILFRGHEKECDRKIYLLLEDEHYLLITSIHAAFSLQYYCDQCLKTHNRNACYRYCPYTCLQCYQKPPCDMRLNKIPCGDCNRFFFGIECFKKH